MTLSRGYPYKSVILSQTGRKQMLKLRIEGKNTDIQEYLKYIHADEVFEVNSISSLYPNRNSVYFRCYLEIELKDQKEGNIDE